MKLLFHQIAKAVTDEAGGDGTQLFDAFGSAQGKAHRLEVLVCAHSTVRYQGLQTAFVKQVRGQGFIQVRNLPVLPPKDSAGKAEAGIRAADGDFQPQSGCGGIKIIVIIFL